MSRTASDAPDDDAHGSFLHCISPTAPGAQFDASGSARDGRGSADRKDLVEIDRQLARRPIEVVLTGGNLTITEVLAVARDGAEVSFTEDPAVLGRIDACYQRMMRDVRDGVPVYGCNTGYGAQATQTHTAGTAHQRLATARAISESIAAIDVGVGPVFGTDVVRAAMLIRVNMLKQGVSGVKRADLELYRQLLNRGITPVVNQYGGLGASGDLAHNGRVVSVLRQLEGTEVWDRSGRVRPAGEVLAEAGLPPLVLDPKAGLGLCNGDNFSTALAILLAVDTMEALLAAAVLGAMTIEALCGTDRSFHPQLDALRPHDGQREVARLYRRLLEGSRLAFQEMKGHGPREVDVSVQDGYSLRGISQYHAVNFEKVRAALDTLTVNANSVSDNPLWVIPDHATPGEAPWEWVSGANFLAMHVAEVLDGLRKTMTQIVKLNDRHLARLVTPHQNNGLPANLSGPDANVRCVFKGVQIQAGMLEVYSALLSIPVTTFFGVHEEGNQDISAHSLTSGILGLENLRLVRYSIAQNLLALAQAVDLRGGPELLAPRTRPVYEFVRDRAGFAASERPLHHEIETLYQAIVAGQFADVLRSETFAGIES
ncbi:MAG TPA: aromatic amino acid ammonia-lyase [Isosphaeraceae bacterium]|jgi:histidine ammonia-lyase